MTTKANPAFGGFRKRRKARGLSQQRLAELAGCSLSFIQLLESGYEPRNSKLVPRVEQVLDGANQSPAEEAGAALSALWRELLAHLGPDFFKGKGDVQFEVTPTGRHAIRVGGTTYFKDGDSLVAATVRGGRAHFTVLDAEGDAEPLMAPLGAPEDN